MNSRIQEKRGRRLTSCLGLILALCLLILFFGLTTDHFFSRVTLLTITNQIPDAVFIAVGMTFVLIVSGIDLSVGSVMGLGGALLGLAMGGWGIGLFPAAVLCMVATTLCGFINGAISVRWSLPSFIVTLGMLEAARGGAYLISNSRTSYIGSGIEVLAETKWIGFSVPFLSALFIVILAQLILSKTVFGRMMVAIGTNEEAVRLSGIRTFPVKVAVFSISGFLAGLAAVSNVSRLGAADPNAGTGFELNAIAAVVIGGTSLMGGRGSVFNSFLGVLIIAVLENGLAQMGAQEPAKRLVTGCVIVAAVVLDYYRIKLSTPENHSLTSKR